MDRFFTLSYEWVENLRNSGDASFAIFNEARYWRHDDDGDRFLVTGDAGWVPLIDEEGIVSPSIEDDQTSGFITYIDGPATLEFEWKVSSEYDYDFLMLLIDGEVVDEISGEMDWAAVAHTIAGDYTHTIEILYEKDDIISDGEDRGFVRTFDVDPD